MKLGTVIKLPDDRIGTICWHNLDGYGGVFGDHNFSHIDQDFSDEVPLPEFMLRKKDVEGLLRKPNGDGVGHRPDLECVGEDFEIIDRGEG